MSSGFWGSRRRPSFCTAETAGEPSDLIRQPAPLRAATGQIRPRRGRGGRHFPGPGPGCGLGAGCAPRASWALGHFRSGPSEALNRPEQGKLFFFQKHFFK